MDSDDDFAESLCVDDHDFWEPVSGIRNRWMHLLDDRLDVFGDLDREGLSALHIAAAFRYDALLKALLANGHQRWSNVATTKGTTPVSIIRTIRGNH